MKSTIGIDVSKDKLDIVLYNQKESSSFIIKNNVSSIRKFLKKHNKVNKVIMEATGTYFLKAAYTAEEMGFYTSVVNPYKIKAYMNYQFLKVKTDKIDANYIAKYGYENKTRRFKEVGKNRYKLRKYVKLVKSLKDNKKAYKNQIEAMSQTPKDEFDDSINLLKNQIKSLNEKIEQLEVKIKNIINSYYKKSYDLLTSIPGIAIGTASVILAYYEDFSDFHSAKKASSFAGINPTPRQSGSSLDTDGGISKKGHAIIRAYLYSSALSAGRFNKQCKKLKERLNKRGKKSKYIYTAIAHKLLRQAFGVVKNGMKYKPNYVNNNS